MILPGTTEFEGVIGTTFDGSITVYPSSDSELKWQSNPVWNSTFDYEIGSGVIGSNGKAYKSLIASVGINPVGDVTGHWEVLTPLNITGYKATIKVGCLYGCSEFIFFHKSGWQDLNLRLFAPKANALPS